MNKIEQAIVFATECHEGQMRKLNNIPYILHPLEVATIISSITNDEDVITAGLLHDVVEDCHVDPFTLEEKFGTRVMELVLSETENKHEALPKDLSWKQRKEESLQLLFHTKDPGIKALWLGDKLSNLRSFYREFLLIGDDIWLRTHQKDKKMHQWYYEAIRDSFIEFKEFPVYQELELIVGKLFS